ncbi:MAG: hypothetical protein ACSHYA_09330 [Opitutaceae bacterium]
MKKTHKAIAALLAAIVLATLMSGCSSTRTENGVTIDNGRSLKFW